jgi:hypothetical protein
MIIRKTLCVLAIAAGSFFPITALADAKDYQVTGEVLSVEDNVVTIQKGDEKWQIDIHKDTKIEGKLKVGEKVTIHYHMVADKIDKKGDEKKSK